MWYPELYAGKQHTHKEIHAGKQHTHEELKGKERKNRGVPGICPRKQVVKGESVEDEGCHQLNVRMRLSYQTFCESLCRFLC